MASSSTNNNNEESEVSTEPFETSFPAGVSGRVLYCGTLQWDAVGKKNLNPADIKCAWVPHQLASFEKIPVKLVISGSAAAHSFLIDTTGRLFSWGRNSCGQLGRGDTVSVGGPELVKGLKEVMHAACGRHHSLVVTSDGACWAFGSNKCGQLGVSGAKTPNILKPTKTTLSNVRRVGCGAEFSGAVTKAGQLFTWGTPEYGVLGHGTDGKYFVSASKLAFDYVTSPTRVQELVAANAHIVDFACGDQHTVAVDKNNRVWTWGFGGYGRLGHREQKDELRPKHLAFFGVRPAGQEPSTPTHIAAGASCCYLVTAAARSYFWGRTKTTGESNMYPKPVGDLMGWHINSIAVGHSSTAVAADSSVITFGPTPSYGELGYGDPEQGAPKSSTKPKLVDVMEGLKTIQVACGFAQTLFIVEENEQSIPKLDQFPILQPVACSQDASGGDDEDEPAAESGASKRKTKPSAATAKKGKSK